MSKNTVHFTLDHPVQHFKSDEAACKLLKDLKLAFREAWPEPYHHWKEMSSNEAMSRMFFYGIGAPLLTEIDHSSGRDY